MNNSKATAKLPQVLENLEALHKMYGHLPPPRKGSREYVLAIMLNGALSTNESMSTASCPPPAGTEMAEIFASYRRMLKAMNAVVDGGAPRERSDIEEAEKWAGEI